MHELPASLSLQPLPLLLASKQMNREDSDTINLPVTVDGNAPWGARACRQKQRSTMRIRTAELKSLRLLSYHKAIPYGPQSQKAILDWGHARLILQAPQSHASVQQNPEFGRDRMTCGWQDELLQMVDVKQLLQHKSHSNSREAPLFWPACWNGS